MHTLNAPFGFNLNQISALVSKSFIKCLCCFGHHLQNDGEPQLEKKEETERKRRRGHAKIRQRRHTRQMKNADNSRISGVSLISCRREVCTH